MKIQLLQANYGDAIHLRVRENRNQYRNILIDGGTKDTWTFKNKNNKTEDGALKKFIKQIRDKKEFIDLLILTHIDDDHIGGVLKWFEDDGQAKDLVKKSGLIRAGLSLNISNNLKTKIIFWLFTLKKD